MTWPTPDRLQTLLRAAAFVEASNGPAHLVRTLRHAASRWAIDGDVAEVVDAYDEACAWLVGRAA